MRKLVTSKAQREGGNMKTQIENFAIRMENMPKSEVIDWAILRLEKAKAYLASDTMKSSADVCIADAFELINRIVK